MLQTHRLELFWEDKKSKFSPNARRSFRLIMAEEVYENWVKLLNLSRKNFSCAQAEELLMNGYCSKIRNYVKLIIKSVNEMEELKKFQSSTFDTVARRRLVGDQDTILELTGRIQELQNEVNCSERFKRFSGCWINSKWKFTRYQSTSVFPASSRSR